MGVFYLESPSMRLLQQKAATGDFEHAVIHSSIIRPAANRFIRQYLSRLHGEPYEPLHPRLKDILAEIMEYWSIRKTSCRRRWRWPVFHGVKRTA